MDGLIGAIGRGTSLPNGPCLLLQVVTDHFVKYTDIWQTIFVILEVQFHHEKLREGQK